MDTEKDYITPHCRVAELVTESFLQSSGGGDDGGDDGGMEEGGEV